MDEQDLKTCTAFEGHHSIASGSLLVVVKKVKEIIGSDEQSPVLIFDDRTGEQIEIDFRGTLTNVRQRVELPAEKVNSAKASSNEDESIPRGPSSPKPGVVSREITLLPRQ